MLSSVLGNTNLRELFAAWSGRKLSDSDHDENEPVQPNDEIKQQDKGCTLCVEWHTQTDHTNARDRPRRTHTGRRSSH